MLFEQQSFVRKNRVAQCRKFANQAIFNYILDTLFSNQSIYAARAAHTRKGMPMKIRESFRTMMRRGDSCKDIILYWLPEIISSTILFSLTPMIDSYLVDKLGSLSTFGALGMANNFLHSLIKLAEAIPVAAIAIMGRYNGAHEYDECGKGLGDTFWTTFFIGFSQFALIFFSAPLIFWWLGVPTKMIAVGTPFLRLRSFGLLLVFSSLALLAFMKAVKNTRVPMIIHCIGIAIFILFDYALILGNLGFPRLGIQGSALATIIQYSVVNVLSVAYILLNPDYKKYFSQAFFSVFRPGKAMHLLSLSWPIMIDKTALSISYVWLSKLIAPMGKTCIATYMVVKDLERFAFLPAIAFAQIITFLVSNRLGERDNEGAMANIKKVLLLTSVLTTASLLVMCVYAPFFIGLFDSKGKFTGFASLALQIVSILVIFDFTQLVLAGALRGAGDVKTVMWGRVLAVTFFFIPISYCLSFVPDTYQSLKFFLIYGSYYVATGIMGIIFLIRIKNRGWQKTEI